MISPRFKLHGNREWKEAALVGPSLPLIVPPFSPFPFRQLRSFFPLVLLVSVKRPSPELSRLDLILASFSLVSRPPRTPAPAPANRARGDVGAAAAGEQYNIRLAHYAEIDRSINSTRRIWAEYARLFYAIFAGTLAHHSRA